MLWLVDLEVAPLGLKKGRKSIGFTINKKYA